MNKEKKLIRNFNALDPAERDMLVSFSEFLSQRSEKYYRIDEPVQITRPPEESIIAAIKRLSETYPMLDKGQMLSEVSEKMTAHIVHGQELSQVIDETEVYFKQQYDNYVQEKQQLIAESGNKDGSA